MNRFMQLIAILIALTSANLLLGCNAESADSHGDAAHDHDGDDHDHDHEHDGDDDDHDHEHAEGDDDHDHDHGGHSHDDEEALGDATIGGMNIAAWQGHGDVAPDKELHIAMTIQDLDPDATVRVWIGTDDRFSSIVEKASFNADDNKWMAHAVAPSPLPDDVAWWIEIVTADGTTSLGSMPIH